ncbi:MAG: 2-phospho-L-lactate guanylyltransferase [Haloarculaceae archaeon]
MDVVVPFGAAEPKTRLGSILDAAQREAFARAMLDDVLAVLSALDRQPTVLADRSVDCDAPVDVDDRSLTDAVNARLPDAAGDEPTAVVMADLALATPDSLAALFEPDADVVLTPGRGGGTNALVARHPAFEVDYHGASIRDHRAIAREAGLDVAHVDSFRLATDVDEPADLVEVALHADGAAATWLRDAGFELVESEGRVELE